MKQSYRRLAVFLFISLSNFILCYSQEYGKRVFDPETDRIEIKHEFRGAWLTTVKGYDWPKGLTIDMSLRPGENRYSQEKRIRMQRDSQKRALVDVITKIKKTGCNVVIMQLCCNSEVFYKSDILPWDHNLTGKQGEDPGYDPLKLAIETAHGLNMQIHGWFNPMRVGFTTNERTKDHLCFRSPERVKTYGKTMYWDPGNPEVIDYLYDLIYEVMSKYDLDGAHIDDFFYPAGLREQTETDGGSSDWDDSELFRKYGNGLNLGQWRESNVNKLVAAMHKAVHDAKPDAVFGVSPRGRLANTKRLYADPRNWVSEKTVDYLAPQIYWSSSDTANQFSQVQDTWKDIVKEVPALPGLASYLYGEKGFESMDEYLGQVEYSRAASFVWGNIWFSSSDMFPESFMSFAREKIYPYQSLVPVLGDLSSERPASPFIRLFSGGIRWKKVPYADKYAVYRLEYKGNNVWTAILMEITSDNKYKKAEKGENYIVVSLRGKMISDNSNVLYSR